MNLSEGVRLGMYFCRDRNWKSSAERRANILLWTPLQVTAGFVFESLPARMGPVGRGSSGWHQKDTEWAYYTADERGSKYRPLDQINESNFKNLEVAWRLKTDNFGSRPEYKLEGTPLMVGGSVYTTAGTRRSVSRSMPKPARSSGYTRCMKAPARLMLRVSFPAAAFPTGAMARATIASCL